MRNGRSRAARLLGGGAAGLLLLVQLAGCPPRLVEPEVLVAPGRYYQLWGVAPFLNESGVSLVDGPSMSDTFAQEAQDAEGIHTIPVNRVIQAMRQIGIREVTTHEEAVTLLRALDLDGLVVGTVTTYEPYRPMKLGLAVQLYRRPREAGWDGLDARALTRATGEASTAPDATWRFPVAQAGGLFDATNHGTLARLAAYATGRTEPESAFGEDVYLVSMDRFAHFACYRLLGELLAQEQVREGPVVSQDP